MALINCPNCGNKVSDKALNCPKCGYSVSTNLPNNENDKARRTEEIRKVEEARREEEARKAEEARIEEARRAEMARREEAAKGAEETRRVDECRKKEAYRIEKEKEKVSDVAKETPRIATHNKNIYSLFSVILSIVSLVVSLAVLLVLVRVVNKIESIGTGKEQGEIVKYGRIETAENPKTESQEVNDENIETSTDEQESVPIEDKEDVNEEIEVFEEDLPDTTSLGDITLTSQSCNNVGKYHCELYFMVKNNSKKKLSVKFDHTLFLNGVAVQGLAHYESEIPAGRSTQLYFTVDYDRIMNGPGAKISDAIISVSVDGGESFEEVELKNVNFNLPW